MINILVFSPHPDDAEMVVGGIIKKFSVKYNIAIVYLTNGENSCSGSTAIRLQECNKACEELSVKMQTFLDIKDLGISRNSTKQRDKVVKIIRQTRPQIILSPHFSDSNVDHIEAYWLVKSSRYIAGTINNIELGSPYYCKYIYYYGQNIATGNNSFFIDVSDVYESKIKALKCYESQFGDKVHGTYVKDVLLERIISKDRHCGAFFGVRYSEEIFYEGKIMILNPFQVINSNL